MCMLAITCGLKYGHSSLADYITQTIRDCVLGHMSCTAAKCTGRVYCSVLSPLGHNEIMAEYSGMCIYCVYVLCVCFGVYPCVCVACICTTINCFSPLTTFYTLHVYIHIYMCIIHILADVGHKHNFFSCVYKLCGKVLSLVNV